MSGDVKPLDIYKGLVALNHAHHVVHSALKNLSLEKQSIWEIFDGRTHLVRDAAYWREQVQKFQTIETADPIKINAIDLHQLSHYMGVAYVMEGSALGGLKLARHVSDALGANHQAGLSFWLAADADRTRWPRFLRVLESALGMQPEHFQSTIDAANACFGIFEKALNPASN